MKPMQFQVSQSHEQLTSQAGLGLIGALLGQTELSERVDQVQIPTRPTPDISHGDVVTTMTGLVALGKPDFEAVKSFRRDPFFRLALGLEQVPSAETLRQRLNGLAGSLETIIREESADLVARQAPAITPCYQKEDQRYEPWVALDVDVSPFDNSDSHKEGVSWTYHQVDGYAPIFAYLGQEGYLINCELRPGSQHSQLGALAFLKQTLKLVRRVTDAKLLVRLDAAHDDIDTVRLLQTTPKVDYILKRNLRQESKEFWLREAMALGECTRPRQGKEVYVGSTLLEHGDWWEEVAFEVIRRTTTADGKILPQPELEVNTWWTSLQATPAEVVQLYHEHGTSEQFHSELKSDLDLERLPSGKFATNHLVLLLGLLAYNILRLCGQTCLQECRQMPSEHRPLLPREGYRRRLRSVLLDLIYQAARLVHHARCVGLVFGRGNPWFESWQRVYLRFCDA